MSLIDSFEDWQTKKAKENYIVNINTIKARRAIRNIIWNLVGIKLPIKTIRIRENSLLVINGQKILRTDRHYHFSNPNDEIYAIFEYLENVKDFLMKMRDKGEMKFLD